MSSERVEWTQARMSGALVNARDLQQNTEIIRDTPAKDISCPMFRTLQTAVKKKTFPEPRPQRPTAKSMLRSLGGNRDGRVVLFFVAGRSQ
jgi:hypothetical protein